MNIHSYIGKYSVIFSDTKSFIESYPSSNRVFVIDEEVRLLPKYEVLFRQVIGDSPVLQVRAKENDKTLDTVTRLINDLALLEVNRRTEIVIIGGGITQDVGALAASLFHRGLRYHLVPTTLLAQSDSCIGSKSSVNLGLRKNVAGSFWPPSSVCIDTGWLSTLDEDAIASGIGEIVKLSIIGGAHTIDIIQHSLDDMFTGDLVALSSGIRMALAVKKRFIEADEFDSGVRRALNYGHCIGHGVEAATEFAVAHGQAVVFGMLVALHIDQIINAETHDKQDQDIQKTLLLRAFRDVEKVRNVSTSAVVTQMRNDKKREKAGLAVLLWNSKRQQHVIEDVDPETVEIAIQSTLRMFVRGGFQ